MNRDPTSPSASQLAKANSNAASVESLLSADDLYLFNQGTHARLYDKLAAHPRTLNGAAGVQFAVWQLDARAVTVEAYGQGSYPLRPRANSGIWEAFVPQLAAGALYKYRVVSRFGDYQAAKADPFAFYCEQPPKTASVVHSLDYAWQDGNWMAGPRGPQFALGPDVDLRDARRLVAPPRRRTLAFVSRVGRPARRTSDPHRLHARRVSAAHRTPVLRFVGLSDDRVLRAHLALWRARRPDVPDRPVAPARHRRGSRLGPVALSHGRARAGLLRRHASLRARRSAAGISSRLGRVLSSTTAAAKWRSFLLSSALFWLDKYHIDALRVDAIASMLYLDYSRKPGEWIPNEFGGRENLAAISFLRELNQHVYREHPDVQTIAEESTAWPMVSRPTYVGGLGFGMKWDMGWMHDTLHYMAKDPVYRKFEHKCLTFRAMYANSENFVLALSHDEVVYGKGSLWNKMAGDEWQKCANLRLMLGYMYALPGKKTLFMGGEFGQRLEWNHESQRMEICWTGAHQGLLRWTEDLNRTYRGEPALYEQDFRPEGFEWIDCCDSDQSIVSFLRRGTIYGGDLGNRLQFHARAAAQLSSWRAQRGLLAQVLNSDARDYGGSGQGNAGAEAAPLPQHGRPWSLNITLPPYAMLIWKPAGA